MSTYRPKRQTPLPKDTGAKPTREWGRFARRGDLQPSAPQPGSCQPAPPESRRLATFPRGEAEELRLELTAYEGRPFVSMRVWSRGTDGEWHPTRRGISIRLHELDQVARVLGDPELRLAGGMRQGKPGAPRGETRDPAMEASDHEP